MGLGREAASGEAPSLLLLFFNFKKISCFKLLKFKKYVNFIKNFIE